MSLLIFHFQKISVFFGKGKSIYVEGNVILSEILEVFQYFLW